MKRQNPSAASQANVRQQNLALLSKLIFSADTPPSRATLASRSGLGRATVSRLINELIQHGIVTELAPEDSTSRGRPGTPVAPAQRSIAGIGLEVNVRVIAGKAIDLSGATLAEFRLTNLDSFGHPEHVLRLLGDTASTMVSNLIDAGVIISGASLGLPGMVSTRESSLLIAPNLGWAECDPVALLGSKWHQLGVHASAYNDAALQSMAATHSRPGMPSVFDRSFLYIAGDVGVGGSLVLDGHPIEGAHGWAGEIGHVTVDPNGPSCACGSRGCVEVYAGQAAIRLAAGLPALAPIHDLIALLDGGDAQAHEAIARAGWALGVGSSDIVNALDLSLLLFGTQLGVLLPWLRPHISEGLRSRVLGHRHRKLSLQASSPLDLPTCDGGAYQALLPVIVDPHQWMLRHRPQF